MDPAQHSCRNCQIAPTWWLFGAEKLWANPTKEMLADLKYAQEVKGLKVVTACLLFDIGKGLTPPVPADFAEKNPDIPKENTLGDME